MGCVEQCRLSNGVFRMRPSRSGQRLPNSEQFYCAAVVSGNDGFEEFWPVLPNIPETPEPFAIIEIEREVGSNIEVASAIEHVPVEIVEFVNRRWNQVLGQRPRPGIEIGD